MREHPVRDAFTDWTGAGYEPGHGDRRTCPECQGCGEIYRVNPARPVTDPDYVTDVLTCALCDGTGRATTFKGAH